MTRAAPFAAPMLALSLLACGQASRTEDLSDTELDSRAVTLREEADELVRDKLAETEEAEPLPAPSGAEE